MDRALTSLSITKSERIVIYKFIAAILHLGNIEFDGNDFECIVVEATEKHVCIAAKLLNLSPEDLKQAMLFRIIGVAGSNIS